MGRRERIRGRLVAGMFLEEVFGAILIITSIIGLTLVPWGSLDFVTTAVILVGFLLWVLFLVGVMLSISALATMMGESTADSETGNGDGAGIGPNLKRSNEELLPLEEEVGQPAVGLEEENQAVNGSAKGESSSFGHLQQDWEAGDSLGIGDLKLQVILLLAAGWVLVLAFALVVVEALDESGRT